MAQQQCGPGAAWLRVTGRPRRRRTDTHTGTLTLAELRIQLHTCSGPATCPARPAARAHSDARARAQVLAGTQALAGAHDEGRASRRPHAGQTHTHTARARTPNPVRAPLNILHRVYLHMRRPGRDDSDMMTRIRRPDTVTRVRRLGFAGEGGAAHGLVIRRNKRRVAAHCGACLRIAVRRCLSRCVLLRHVAAHCGASLLISRVAPYFARRCMLIAARRC